MTRDAFASIWDDAAKRYAEVSGEDFSDRPWPRTTEELCKSLEAQNSKYTDFKNKQAKLFSILETTFKPIEVIIKIVGDAASTLNSPIAILFGAFKHLINAAHGVSATLDAITDLLEVLKNFTTRLKIYQREDLSKELREKLTEILVTTIDIFARTTKIVKDGTWYRFKSFGKGILIGDDKTMQGLVSRLDKLTKTEDLVVAAETLIVSKQTARAVDSVQSSMQNLSTREGQILTLVEESNSQAAIERDLRQLETIKKALSPTSFAQDRYDEIKREHAPNSGDWIRSEEALQAWAKAQAPILWVSGNPGFGKSFLTYNIITYLHESIQNQGDAGGSTSVAYFFFKDNKEQTRSFEQALRDIAYQITQTDKAYAKHVLNVFHSSPDVTSIRSAWQKLFADYFIGDKSNESTAYVLFDGVDEAFVEGRGTFFELLNDIKNEKSSRIHFAMLGRPQITDELSLELGDGIPTIEVDRTKNGHDIAHYVELSIKKSPKLKRFPETLKREIIDALSAKADGMFMWVKLMITELSQKSRPSAIKEALLAAPKGLNEMLQHVLEGFSASLEEEDASDLNDMLAWVALAKRPISLGELDASLRLKSADGEGVIYLEGRLRKQFASFFSLKREDALTTADLQTQKKYSLEDDDPQADPEDNEGMDDVENETDFDSNPATTGISFSHASISDFLRDPKQGKVKAHGNHPFVGVDVRESQLKIAQTCLALFSDEDLLARMKDAVSLQSYAATFWNEHLDAVDLASTSDEDRTEMAKSVVKILQEKPLIDLWIARKPQEFFCADRAKVAIRWLTDHTTCDHLSEDLHPWLTSAVANPIELFEPAVRRLAEQILVVDSNFLVKNCIAIIHAYLIRKAGGHIETISGLTAEQIGSCIKWADFKETADWHRRVAMVYREFEYYDEALTYFNKAMSLEHSLWTARTGIAMTYILQKKYHEALKMLEENFALAERDDTLNEGTRKAHLWRLHIKCAECYQELAKTKTKIEDLKEKVRLRQLANDYLKKAFMLVDTDYACITKILDNLWMFVHRDSVRINEVEGTTIADYGIPDEAECSKQILDLIHLMDDMPKNDTTNLVGFLMKHMYDDSYMPMIAEAAVQRNELEWLQSKWREAIAWADKNRLPVVSANLVVALGVLYAMYGNDEDRAVRLWEAVGSERITSTALATDIGYARTMALNHLGRHYICKAIEDESQAEHYAKKMEYIAMKRRYGSRMGVEDSIPPNDVALYLAAWYTKIGREQEARAIVKPHIQEALVILSDDDPSNDMDGYRDLSRALLAAGDETNAIAVYHAMRMNETTEKSNEAQSNEDTVDEDASEDVNTEARNWTNQDSYEDRVWWCDGNCEKSYANYDDAILCRYCLFEFEKDCHTLLLEGKLPAKICRSEHSFLVVPRLREEQVFKEDEILVEGKVMSLDVWKKSLKRQYGL